MRLAIILLALALPACGVDKEWLAFRDARRCKVVGRISETTNLGITSSGKSAVVFNAAMTQWLCSDGITYTREHDDREER